MSTSTASLTSPTRFLVPPHGNPVRPIFFLLVVSFAAMLVAFPVLMSWVGLGTGSIIVIALVIVFAAAICLGFTVWYANSVERDRVALDSTDVWASWWLSVDEYRQFAASERRKNLGWSLVYLVLGMGLAAYFAVALDDQLTATIMVVAFLLFVGVMVTLGGPPWRATDDAREVRIGPRGVQSLGRYTPLAATMTRLQSVSLEPGTPAVLTFQIRSGRQQQYIHVPVTQERWAEAEALVTRFQQG